MRFHNKTVLITGASFGVGRACAEAFHAEGAAVVMTARRADPLDVAARALPRARTFAVDACDHSGMAKVLATVASELGGIDGVVNNAGAHFRGPIEGRSEAEIATMVDVNLRAPIVLTRQALPYLRRRGGGFVVNVASLAGRIPLDGAATYSATKFGLRAFTFALAEELRGSGISVSAVSPGPIDTGFIMDELDEVEDIVFSQQMCSAADVAKMVLDCADDGRRERAFPAGGARLATLGYLVPALRRRLKPMLERKGKRVKDRLRRERFGPA